MGRRVGRFDTGFPFSEDKIFKPNLLLIIVSSFSLFLLHKRTENIFLMSASNRTVIYAFAFWFSSHLGSNDKMFNVSDTPMKIHFSTGKKVRCSWR